MTAPKLTPEQRDLLDSLFDKWSLSVLDAVCERPRRFNELKRELSPITSRALTQTLRRLTTDGFVVRTVLDTSPVHVEYVATDFGRTLQQPMLGLFRWAAESLPQVEAHRGAA